MQQEKIMQTVEFCLGRSRHEMQLAPDGQTEMEIDPNHDRR